MQSLIENVANTRATIATIVMFSQIFMIIVEMLDLHVIKNIFVYKQKNHSFNK